MIFYGNKAKNELQKHKEIFDFKNESAVATISDEGIPNIVPIHSKHFVPFKKVLISDQFMNKTKNNIIENSYGELIIKEKETVYRIGGICEYKTSGFMFNRAVNGVKKYTKQKAKNKSIKLKCKGIILMNVTELTIEKEAV